MEVTVLIESSRRTCESSRVQEDLAGWRVKDGGNTRQVTEMRMEYNNRGQFGGLGLKTIGDRFRGFGPQNPWRFRGGTDNTWWHREVRLGVKLAHEGAVAVE
jgi:hypothetical protein